LLLWETIHFPLHYCLLLLLAAIVVSQELPVCQTRISLICRTWSLYSHSSMGSI
jgi:hypothetical protein